MPSEVQINFCDFEVAVVENQPYSLHGLIQRLNELGCTTVWTARDPDEARQKAQERLPDVVFVDLRLVRGGDHEPGFQLIKELKDLERHTAIVIYSGTPVVNDIVLESIRLGCSYLVKEDAWDHEKDIIASALLAARSNAVMLSHEVVGCIEDIMGRMATADLLSARELEALALVAEGYSDRDIGSTLYITVPTVKSHLRHIYRKLGVSNRTQAARWYREHYG